MSSFKNVRVVVAGLATALSIGVWVYAVEEVELTLDEVPAAVRATILREAAGAEITEIERETEDGRVVYEAEFSKDGHEVEIQIAADGTVLEREIEAPEETEQSVTMEQLPPAVRNVLKKMAGTAPMDLERETNRGITTYEAEWQSGGTTREVAVAVDGTVLEVEETIALVAAPPAVQTVVASHFGGSRVVVEKKTITLYEIEGVVDGDTVEMLVSGAGHVYRANATDDDDDADDEDDDDEDDDDDEADEDDGE